MDYYDHFGSNDKFGRLNNIRPENRNERSRRAGEPPARPPPPSYPEVRSISGSNAKTKTSEEKKNQDSNKDDHNTSKKELPFKKRFLRAVNVFAETCSIAGLSYIQSSDTKIRRLSWASVFTIFLVVTVYHLSTLFVQFYKYPIQTQVSIKTGTVAYPSVTLCNINPVRTTQLGLNPALENFVAQYQESFQGTEGGARRRKRRATGGSGAGDTDTGTDGSDTGTDTGTDGSDTDTGNADDEEDPFGYIYDYGDYEGDYDAGDYFAGTTDPELQADTKFVQLLGQSSVANRTIMGHQIKTMLLSCTFNGKICYYSNFTQSLNRDYGNCFTFNSDATLTSALKTRFVGPEYGLSLELYKEDDEYLEAFTSGAGWRVVVHPFGTLPYPLVSGLSTAPNAETFVAITYSNVSRPGDPYEDCEKNDHFRSLYNADYTLEACQATCVSRNVIKNCSCYLPENIELYPVDTPRTLSPCNSTERKCATQVAARINLGVVPCGCLKACKETNVNQILSTNQWPDIGFYTNLVDKLCMAVGESDDKCSQYRAVADGQEQYDILSRNFGRVNIYFRSLTTNIIKEEGSYGLSRFASDIGGVAGLWLGLSVFSAVEIINFLAHLVKYAYFEYRQKHPKEGPGSKDRYFDRTPRMYNNRWLDDDYDDDWRGQRRYGRDYYRDPYSPY